MLSPKPYIQKLTPPAHGGRLYHELQKLGIEPDSIVDFSVSINPLGPPAGLRQALIEADLENYPDTDSHRLKNRLAVILGLSPVNLIIGNGSTELIRLAAAAYLGPGDRALVLQPTYGEYETAVRLTGAAVTQLALSESQDFRLNWEQLENCLKAVHPRALFLCNPNNPTGEYLDEELVSAIIAQNPDCLVVLDEAYIGFLERTWASSGLIQHPNLLVIRSLTKDYAMAGVRLGYAFAHTNVIEALNKIKPPWNVSAPAQAAGLYVLDQAGYIEQAREHIAAAGRYLKSSLIDLGLRPLPSQSNFFLVKVGDAAGLRAALLPKGLLIRDCTSFGLPQYIRLACRTRPQCQRLVAALQESGPGWGIKQKTE
jgi:histidinol-phosphate aminotransferase